MQISAFEILGMVRELKEIIGAYIDKIYQIGKEDILLRVRGSKIGRVNLIISAGRWIFKSKEKIDTPEKPSMFAMALRKYLSGNKIADIYQHDFDRIMVMETSGYRLVMEFIPNGNLILVDEGWKIVLPMKEQVWSHRVIKPGETYLFPPSRVDVRNADPKNLADHIKNSGKDLVRTLAIDLGLGGIYAEEVCLRSGVDKERETKDLNEGEIEKVTKSLRELMDAITEEEPSPEIIFDDEGEIVAVTPIHLRRFDGCRTIRKSSLSEALEEAVKLLPTESPEDKERERVKRQMERQKIAIEDLLKRSEEKRREGDLLYIHMKEVDEILERLRKISKEKDKEKSIREIESLDLVEKVELHDGIVRLRIEDRVIEVDFRKSAAENANLAYELSKKYREKAERARRALEESKRKLAEEKREEREEREFWFERYRWCISSDGNLIIAGRDAKTNERIVKRHMESGDIYIHPDIHGAPSCLLKCRDINGREKEITEKAIREACQFASVYSKAWKQFGEVMVYWVYPDQVSKTPESGEFLPKGSFVIRGKRNYVRCKMEMAVGEIFIEGVRKIMGGAVDSVKARSDRFVVIQPGYIKRERFAKILAEKLRVTPDRILRALPPGDVQIIESKGLSVEELR